MLRITQSVTVPLSALQWRYSASSGPGGQHANKTATRVQLRLPLARIEGLDAARAERLRARLGARVLDDGTIGVTAQSERSQLSNRNAALEALCTLLRAALHEPRRRKATRPTGASKRRRRAAKQHRSALKQQRRGE